MCSSLFIDICEENFPFESLKDRPLCFGESVASRFQHLMLVFMQPFI